MGFDYDEIVGLNGENGVSHPERSVSAGYKEKLCAGMDVQHTVPVLSVSRAGYV